MKLLTLLLCNVFVLYGAAGSGSSCCPPAELISPCTCQVDSVGVNLDCSGVADGDQLANILQRQLPCKTFRGLEIQYNFDVKRLNADTFSDVTFEEVYFWIGGLEAVEDDTFSKMSHTLKLLLLDLQKLEEFPFHTIETFSNLTVLDLSGNLISSFPDYLASDSLEVLSFAYNPLKKLPENPFNLLPKLNEIYLGNTQLQFLPNGMDVGLQKSANIDLGGNQISTLDEKVWRPLMEKQVNMIMKDNALECGCDVAWYVNTEEFHHLVHDAVCVNGEYLNQLDAGLFTDC